LLLPQPDSCGFHALTMNLVAHDPRQPIEICGFSLPVPSCVIHLYYSAAERRRFTSFLAEGIAEGDTVLLACTREGYEELTQTFELDCTARKERRLLCIEILPDLASSVAKIAQALSAEVRDRRRRIRLLADFGLIAGPEMLFELEALLSSALRGFNVISITQYDGRAFAASATIEQFHTHALAIIGNAVCKENRNYTAPDNYLQTRAASAKA